MYALSKNSIFDANCLTMNSWGRKLVILFGLTVIADWLFYDQKLGITIALFFSALAVCVLVAEKTSLVSKSLKLNIIILIASLLPLIEELNFLTFIFGCFGIINFTFNQSHLSSNSLLEKISLGLLFILRMPFKFLADIIRLASLRKRIVQTKSSMLSNWVLPILMTSGFLFLFAIANPLISNWFYALDLSILLSFLNFDRIIFWVLIAIVSWSFLKPSFQKLKTHLPKIRNRNEETSTHKFLEQGLLNEATVFRSLILFNGLFATQTALDFQYLWIGKTLPNNVTFSQYVHNGTYILIFTTLLAASFILFVTSAKKRHEKSPRVMGLLLAWIVQNIILVLSNIMRMELYVEAFALTYLRLTVLIWLALVSIGLVLIIIRLFKGHSNVWLIKSNLISTFMTLYLTSFANLPYFIADYNLKTAEQNFSKRLDINYIVKLGPNTIPILDRIIKNPRWERQIEAQKYWYGINNQRQNLNEARKYLAYQANHEYSDWRQWNFRDYRLHNFIKQIEPSVLPN